MKKNITKPQTYEQILAEMKALNKEGLAPGDMGPIELTDFVTDGYHRASEARQHATENHPAAADPIQPVLWGRDHLSTLLYVETRVADHRGTIKREHMRCDRQRHPLQAHLGSMGGPSPTQLADGTLRHDHDDWDILDDLERAGLLIWGGTGMHPVIRLTDLGWTVSAALRRSRGEAALRRARAEGETRDEQAHLLRTLTTGATP